MPSSPASTAPFACAACGAAGASKRCARCKAVVYCGPACQRRHWTDGGHKAACVAAPDEPSSAPAASAGAGSSGSGSFAPAPPTVTAAAPGPALISVKKAMSLTAPKLRELLSAHGVPHGHCAEEDGNANRRLYDRPHFSVDHGVVLLLEPRGVNECQQVSQRRDHSENLRPLDQVAVNFFGFGIGQA